MADIPPITLHPSPHPGEKLSKWFERLAIANFIEFDILLKYVGSVAKSVGFKTAVKKITNISDLMYFQLTHDLKEKYWEDLACCPIKDCKYRSISKNTIETLRKHFSLAHDIGIKWYYCDLCDFKGRLAMYITHHKAKAHNIGRKWFKCEHCRFKTDNKKTLESHKANRHNIGTKWFFCDLCGYKTKHKSHIKVHKRNIHDIDVVWFSCSICDYRSKEKSQLRRHIKLVHKGKKSMIK
jgi:hypothetical protein